MIEYYILRILIFWLIFCSANFKGSKKYLYAIDSQKTCVPIVTLYILECVSIECDNSLMDFSYNSILVQIDFIVT